MIKINLKNAIKESEVLKFKEEVENISKKIEKYNVEGFEFLGWKNLVKNRKEEIKNINSTAKYLKKHNVDTLVVIGIGGSYIGSKAGIEMIKGQYPINYKGMEIVYIGESLSSTNLSQKLFYIQNKNFAINVISKSGKTIETSIAFRMCKNLLEEKIGLNNASKFIIATTDAHKGILFEMASRNKYKKFIIPDDVGGRFSVLTAVGLLPMACAGINIEKVIQGALIATEKYEKHSLKENDAYKYAVTRYVLNKKYPIELMVQYENQMASFNEWWKQLAGESEGKNEKGLFPASSIFSTDLHSLGQFIQEGSKVIFETVITTKEPNKNLPIIKDKENHDKLNYLNGKTIHDINKIIFDSTIDAHVKVGKVPNIHILINKMDEYHFGELVIFFERAITMTAYLLRVNPFNQPGVEIYKNNMLKKLKEKKRKS